MGVVYCWSSLVLLWGFFDKAVGIIDYFPLMKILKFFGLGFCCGSFFLSFFVCFVCFLGFVLFGFGFLSFSYTSTLPGPEGN